MAKVMYVVAQPDGSGETYTSLKELAGVFNVDKITKKDIEAGNYPVLVMTEDEYADQIGMTDAELEQDLYDQADAIGSHTHYGDDAYDHYTEDGYPEIPNDDPHIQTELDEDTPLTNEDGDTSDDTTGEDTPLTNTGTGRKQTLANEEVEYPEVGHFDTEKALKKFYKKLSDDQLDEWLELEGLEYKPCDHEAINRMRKCMAILEHHFPKQPKVKNSSKSKYSDYTNEQLIKMLVDNKLEVPDTKGSEQILRMRAIMALRDAKVLS